MNRIISHKSNTSKRNQHVALAKTLYSIRWYYSVSANDIWKSNSYLPCIQVITWNYQKWKSHVLTPPIFKYFNVQRNLAVILKVFLASRTSTTVNNRVSKVRVLPNEISNSSFTVSPPSHSNRSFLHRQSSTLAISSRTKWTLVL